MSDKLKLPRINHAKLEDKTSFGFWAYLMTDLVLFATLFATYAVLRDSIHTGPSGAEIFNMPFVLTETMILLASSFTMGLAMIAIRRHNKNQALGWLLTTFALGAAFLGMEIYEFGHLVNEGYNWSTSAFLSAFFALVGTHGAHIAIGLIWMFVLMLRLEKRGFNRNTTRRLTLLSLFWHFLDVVWIFIFTFVYLIGVAA